MVGATVISRKDFESSGRSKQKKCSTPVKQRFKKPCNGCHKIFVTFAKENSLNFAKTPYLCRICRKQIPENCACHHCQKLKRQSANYSYNSLAEKALKNHSVKTCSVDMSSEPILPKRKPLSNIKSLIPACKVKKSTPRTNFETNSFVKNDKLLENKLNKFKVDRKHADNLSNPLLPLDKSLETMTLMKNTTAFSSSKEFLFISNEMTPPATNNSVHLRNPNKFRCQFCSQEFYRRKTFNIHIRRHKMFGCFNCPYCSSSFRVKGALGVHLLYIHHECSVCKQLFSSYDDVLFHKFENHAKNWWSMEVLDSDSECKPVKKSLGTHCHSLRKRVSTKMSSNNPNEIITSVLESSCRDESTNTSFLSCHEENYMNSSEQIDYYNNKNVSNQFNLKKSEKNENPSGDLFSHNSPTDTDSSLLQDGSIMGDLCSNCTCQGESYRKDLIHLRKNIGILLSKFCQMDLLFTLKPNDKSIDKFVLKLIALSEGKEMDES